MSISSKAPNGTVWFYYLVSEGPTPGTAVTQNPDQRLIRDTVYESPVFFSTPGRTLARKWAAANNGGVSLRPMPMAAAQFEYVEFLTPAGVSFVYGVGDDGNLYLERLTEVGHGKRLLVTTIMHKKDLLWVADNRLGVPGRS